MQALWLVEHNVGISWAVRWVLIKNKAERTHESKFYWEILRKAQLKIHA